MTPAAPYTVGRLAPSPTGLLHLGNAWAFLLAWCAARANMHGQDGTGGQGAPREPRELSELGGQAERGRIVLRIEDLDPQRSKPEFTRAIIEDLTWLGLDWDGDILYQSARADVYQAALARLHGHVYPCFCTRQELRSLAGAPHVDDAGAPYSGRCRHLTGDERATLAAQGRKQALRLACPQGAAGTITFDDAVCGPQHCTLDDVGGDFALRRSDGVMAYQLAVVVDDATQGVNQVVRGRDILSSTPRQILLCRLLGLPQPPQMQYAHVPLLCDADGERLAKRHQSLSLRALREAGVRAEAIVGLLGCLAGMWPQGRAAHPQELVPHFAWARLPAQDVRVTPDMLAGLTR